MLGCLLIWCFVWFVDYLVDDCLVSLLVVRLISVAFTPGVGCCLLFELVICLGWLLWALLLTAWLFFLFVLFWCCFVVLLEVVLCWFICFWFTIFGLFGLCLFNLLVCLVLVYLGLFVIRWWFVLAWVLIVI